MFSTTRFRIGLADVTQLLIAEMSAAPVDLGRRLMFRLRRLYLDSVGVAEAQKPI